MMPPAAASSSSMSSAKKSCSSSASTAVTVVAGTAADPVCLLDSDSDDDDDCQLVASSGNSDNGDDGKSKAKAKAAAAGHDEGANTVRGTAARRKRPANASAGTRRASANAAANNNGTLADRFVPFRMCTTSNDLRPSGSSSSSSTTSSTHNHNCNLGSLKFIIIYNYLLDFDFLLQEISELLSLDRTIVLLRPCHEPHRSGPVAIPLAGTMLTIRPHSPLRTTHLCHQPNPLITHCPFQNGVRGPSHQDVSGGGTNMEYGW